MGDDGTLSRLMVEATILLSASWRNGANCPKIPPRSVQGGY